MSEETTTKTEEIEQSPETLGELFTQLQTNLDLLPLHERVRILQRAVTISALEVENNVSDIEAYDFYKSKFNDDPKLATAKGNTPYTEAGLSIGSKYANKMRNIHTVEDIVTTYNSGRFGSIVNAKKTMAKIEAFVEVVKDKGILDREA